MKGPSERRFFSVAKEPLRLAGTEVDDGGEFRQAATRDFLCAIGGVKLRLRKAGVDEDVVDVLHVLVVVAVGAVFVFDLDSG